MYFVFIYEITTLNCIDDGDYNLYVIGTIILVIISWNVKLQRV